MKLQIYCSTPNFRGIHQYSLYLYRLCSEHYSARYLSPGFTKSSLPKLIVFICQLLWELVPRDGSALSDFEIFSYPRLPLRFFLLNGNKSKTGIVVHDFIQCINKFSAQDLFFLFRNQGFLALLKCTIHSILFNLSLSKVDFILFNSCYTQAGFRSQISKSNLRLLNHSLILHPSPSFSSSTILETLADMSTRDECSRVGVHVVTGFSPSKRTLLLESWIAALGVFSIGSRFKFHVNIFGYESEALYQAQNESMRVVCNPGFVEEAELVKSSLHSQFFLSTSQFEGFGIPLLDSIMFGHFCICMSIPSFREIAYSYQSSFSSVVLVDELACNTTELFLKSLVQGLQSDFLHTPEQRAETYIDCSTRIHASSSHRLHEFIESQFVPLSL